MSRRPKLVADLMCGAGGTTAGAKAALDELGHDVQFIVLNHWDIAVRTHTVNFPQARHYCQDVAAARPIVCVPEGYLDLLMASPTCTHHSRARGGRPTSDQQRSDPWHIITWLTELRVKRLLIENVPEFAKWGPVDMRTGRPLRSREGEYFNAWLDAIKRLGFRGEYRFLNAADYGGLTTRVRFFLLARSDGRRLSFPVPSHSRDGTADLFGDRRRWRTAREAIDWTRRGRSIFTRPKPLAAKTLARIFAGALRFDWPEPYLVILRRHCDALSIDLPLPTITARGTHIALAQPSLTPFVLAQAAGGAARGVDDPMPTIVAGGAVSLTQPVLISVTGGDRPKAPRSVDAPIGTITTRNGLGIAEPLIAPYYGSGSGETCRSAEQPLGTITTLPRFGLVEASAEPFLLPQHSDEAGRVPRVHDVAQPLPTVTTVARIGMVQASAEAFVLNRHGDNGAGRAHSVEEPMPTATTSGAGYLVEASAEPFLAAHFGERPGQDPRVHSVDRPLPTVTHRGAGDLVEGVAVPLVVQTDQTGGGGRYTRSVEEPLGTAVTKQNQALVEPVMAALADAAAADADLRTALDQGRVFLVDGQPYVFDILFRMLEPEELGRGMSFPPGYQFVGNKTQVTRQIGNAVEHHQAKALVKALFEDEPAARRMAFAAAAE